MALLGALCAVLLASCSLSTRPIVKIGLVAPFEGRYRDVGYEVIYAVRLAIREANASGGVSGYSVELVAFDDGGDPDQAAEQARKVAADPQVVAVTGHWLPATTQAAAQAYREEGLPLLVAAESSLAAPGLFHVYPTSEQVERAAAEFARARGWGDGWAFCPCGLLPEEIAPNARAGLPVIGSPLWGQTQFWSLNQLEGAYFVAPVPLPSDLAAGDSFAERYLAISNGVPPGSLAVLAYDATQAALDAIAQSIRADGVPSREGAAAALRGTIWEGVSGEISFDARGRLRSPATRVYQWRSGEVVPAQ